MCSLAAFPFLSVFVSFLAPPTLPLRAPSLPTPSVRPSGAEFSEVSAMASMSHVFSVLGAVSRMLGVLGRDASSSDIIDWVSSNRKTEGPPGTLRKTLGDGQGEISGDTTGDGEAECEL